MGSKKLILPLIILLAAVIAMAVFGIIDGIALKPVITEHAFPFSITYEWNGTIGTEEGVYECVYLGTGGHTAPRDRFYSGKIQGRTDDDPNDFVLFQDEKGVLTLFPNLYADHLMGDPLYGYDNGEACCEPILIYHDNEGTNSVEGSELPEYDARIISWEYPEPLENCFVFSHIAPLSGRSVIPTVLIGLLALVACVIFVKKEQDLVYQRIDKISIVSNLVILLVVIPFFTIVSAAYDLVCVGMDLIDQIGYCIPAITALGLSASLCLRRKGYHNSGAVVQFVGPALFAIWMMIP